MLGSNHLRTRSEVHSVTGCDYGQRLRIPPAIVQNDQMRSVAVTGVATETRRSDLSCERHGQGHAYYLMGQVLDSKRFTIQPIAKEALLCVKGVWLFGNFQASSKQTTVEAAGMGSMGQQWKLARLPGPSLRGLPARKWVRRRCALDVCIPTFRVRRLRLATWAHQLHSR